MNSGSWYWPDISDLDGAKDACRLAMWCAIAVAGFTLLFSLLAVAGTSIAGASAYSFVDAGLFALIAFGLQRHSRFAAVSGFVLFLMEKIFMIVQTGSVLGIGAIGFVVLIGFFNGIRGTFAHAKLSRQALAYPPPFS